MKRYLPVTYYGNENCYTDALSVVKNFNRLFVPCETGHVTEEDIANYGDATILKLDVVPNNGYKRFKVEGVKGHTMKGYGFVYSSDSRFSAFYGDYPIALHDRQE